MTNRRMRHLPTVLLMTTALAWNLPALAQTGTSGSAQMPPSSSAGTPPGGLAPQGSGTGLGVNPARPAPGNVNSNGLPADLTPAMPPQSQPRTAPASRPGQGSGMTLPPTQRP
ncbi:hypothetical protein [Ottowia thiooxydans]|uniref:hypothetical protein n=1 Tax=Ottowia thiooxydans TaxID=219182 RepID=UPI0012EC8751|nr:hypothetical protein [Ottowia thiooxydans]